MADITDPSQLDHGSPIDDPTGNGEPRGTKRPRVSAAADDDDDDDEKGGRERRKIEIKFIQDKSRRHITFSKRKAGIMKKVGHLPAASLSIPTDQLLLTGVRTLCAHWYPSPSASRVGDWPCLHIYHSQIAAPRHQTRRQELDPGKAVNPSLAFYVADFSSQACLNAADPAGDQNGVDAGDVPESPEDVTSLPPNHGGMARGVPQGGYMPQQQVNDPYYGMQAQGGQYAGMPGMPQHQRGAV